MVSGRRVKVYWTLAAVSLTVALATGLAISHTIEIDLFVYRLGGAHLTSPSLYSARNSQHDWTPSLHISPLRRPGVLATLTPSVERGRAVLEYLQCGLPLGDDHDKHPRFARSQADSERMVPCDRTNRARNVVLARPRQSRPRADRADTPCADPPGPLRSPSCRQISHPPGSPDRHCICDQADTIDLRGVPGNHRSPRRSAHRMYLVSFRDRADVCRLSSNSFAYWTKDVLAHERIAQPLSAGNGALHGLLPRLGLFLSSAPMDLLSVAVLVLGLAVAKRVTIRYGTLQGVLVCAARGGCRLTCILVAALRMDNPCVLLARCRTPCPG